MPLPRKGVHIAPGGCPGGSKNMEKNAEKVKWGGGIRIIRRALSGVRPEIVLGVPDDGENGEEGKE